VTRVLVLGGSGMLGHRASLAFAEAGGFEVHVTVRRPVPAPFIAAGAVYHEGIDLSGGSAAVGRVLRELAPDVVVNAIGAIKQKDLDATLDETMFLNGALPHLLPLLNPNRAGRVLHVSTDCVFTGTRGGYKEGDVADAEDLYGRSKAVGEIAYGRHLTLRTSIVGFELAGHLGLISWLFCQPRGSRVDGFRHAIYSGLTSGVLSRAMVGFARDPNAPTGLWHIASEPIDKGTLLQRLNEAFDLGLEVTSDTKVHIDRSLDDGRIRVHTGTVRPSWDELIADLERDWAAWPYETIYAARRASARRTI
jgi:dTDP-4-dehydrorhamnose reductase